MVRVKFPATRRAEKVGPQRLSLVVSCWPDGQRAARSPRVGGAADAATSWAAIAIQQATHKKIDRSDITIILVVYLFCISLARLFVAATCPVCALFAHGQRQAQVALEMGPAEAKRNSSARGFVCNTSLVETQNASSAFCLLRSSTAFGSPLFGEHFISPAAAASAWAERAAAASADISEPDRSSSSSSALSSSSIRQPASLSSYLSASSRFFFFSFDCSSSSSKKSPAAEQQSQSCCAAAPPGGTSARPADEAVLARLADQAESVQTARRCHSRNSHVPPRRGRQQAADRFLQIRVRKSELGNPKIAPPHQIQRLPERLRHRSACLAR